MVTVMWSQLRHLIGSCDCSIQPQIQKSKWVKGFPKGAWLEVLLQTLLLMAITKCRVSHFTHNVDFRTYLWEITRVALAVTAGMQQTILLQHNYHLTTCTQHNNIKTTLPFTWNLCDFPRWVHQVRRDSENKPSGILRDLSGWSLLKPFHRA